MRLKLKEDPKEWRKQTCFGALGLTVLCTLLRWRHILPSTVWLGVITLSAALVASAFLRPQFFRGYYRISVYLGFYISQIAGQFILAAFFIFVVTPLGLALRLLGKDLLRLKRLSNVVTYWIPKKEERSMDRLF